MLPRLYSPADEPTGTSAAKFEDLLGRLEQIVADMENAEMPLEKLLSGYEEGMRLVKTCGDRLMEAEQKVEILSRTPAAEPAKGMPAATADTVPAPATPDPTKPDEEIRLF